MEAWGLIWFPISDKRARSYSVRTSLTNSNILLNINLAITVLARPDGKGF